MLKGLILFSLLFTTLAAPAQSQSKPVFDLTKYSCNQFLKDLTQPDAPGKLVRSILMMGWAAGYRAGQQNNPSGADAKSLRDVSAAIGTFCKTKPNSMVIDAFVSK
jgi:hypothetical protein